MVLMTPMRGDGVGNRVVEQTVERVKLFDGDGRICFTCQLGDGLADISVTVDHLVHGVALGEQLFAMQGSGTAAFDRTRGLVPGSGNYRVSPRRVGPLTTKRLDKLVEE
jgi:hypothetical protein